VYIGLKNKHLQERASKPPTDGSRPATDRETAQVIASILASAQR
jgi:hypothetical protein